MFSCFHVTTLHQSICFHVFLQYMDLDQPLILKGEPAYETRYTAGASASVDICDLTVPLCSPNLVIHSFGVINYSQVACLCQSLAAVPFPVFPWLPNTISQVSEKGSSQGNGHCPLMTSMFLLTCLRRMMLTTL